jgi:hypothetical protein
LRKEQFLAPIEEIGKGRQKTTSEGEDLFWSLRGCGRGYQALEAAMRGLGSFLGSRIGPSLSAKRTCTRFWKSVDEKIAIVSVRP